MICSFLIRFKFIEPSQHIFEKLFVNFFLVYFIITYFIKLNENVILITLVHLSNLLKKVKKIITFLDLVNIVANDTQNI